MKILDGKIIAEKVLEKIRNEINGFKIPVLSIVLVGDDEGSKVYVERKRLAAEKVGISVNIISVTSDVGRVDLEEIIKTNAEQADGIILQLPLPELLRTFTEEIINNIPINKDVDCLRADTLLAATNKEIKWLPPIVEAVDEIVSDINFDLIGKKICLVGNGKVTGMPLSVIYKARGYDVEVVDSKTVNINEYLKNADVVISATGSAHLITSDLIKEGALIIDAGFARKDGKIVGDVDRQGLENIDVILCPSPGGIGPITVATLLLNVVKASKKLEL